MTPPGLASGHVPVEYMVLSGGFAGTDQTVALMRQLTSGVYGSRSPKIRALAINILRSAGVPEKSYQAEMVALHNWVRDNIRYTRDVYGQETLAPPEETAFNTKAGDCDDKSVLLAALLGAVGIPTRFKVLGVTPEQYSHVYLQAQVGGQWVSLDPIMRDKPAGWEAPKHLRAIEKVYPINAPEGITMRRGMNGLGYVGDPRIVSHLEAEPPPEQPPGPYVLMDSFLDNDAPIEQLSNQAPAFPQDANIARKIGPPTAKRMRAHLATMRGQADEQGMNGAEEAAMLPGMGMGDVMTPDALADMGAPAISRQQPRPNMQRPAMAVRPEGIDVAFGRNALVVRGDRGDRIEYRGLWALNEQPPIRRVGGVSGMGGMAPGTTGRRTMLPGMGYLAGRTMSGPGLAELADGVEVVEQPQPERPINWGALAGLALIAVGVCSYMRRK